MAMRKSQHGDDLVETIIRKGGRYPEQLLAAFRRGHPVTNLRSLLDSTDEGVLQSAAWIMSELGEAAAPLLPACAQLLQHPSHRVRFYALECVARFSGEPDGALIAAAIQLLRDEDTGVRWQALMFISRAANEQLACTVPEQADQELASLTEWLFSLETAANASGDIVSKMTSTILVERSFAAAGAYRMRLSDPGPLMVATGSNDPDIASFAAGVLTSTR